jgi:NADH dehydrogenase (ubiquinone) Fe-S protein 1
MFAMKGRRSFSSTSTRKADITLSVDGKEVSVPQGATPVQQHVPTPMFVYIGSALIQACEAAGVAIPRCIYSRQ